MEFTLPSKVGSLLYLCVKCFSVGCCAISGTVDDAAILTFIVGRGLAFLLIIVVAIAFLFFHVLTWHRNILLLFVYFFVFFTLLIALPVVCCLLTVLQENLAVREDLSDRLELGHDDEAHEARLTVRDVCLLAIAQK